MTLWLVLSAIVFLFLHRMIERMVCSGGDVVVRKFACDCATVGLVAVGWAAALVWVLWEPARRGDWGGLAVLLTPVLALALYAYFYLAFLAYERREYADYGADMGADDE
jgi:hypothetical protein